MATHSNILEILENFMDIGAWQAIVHGITKLDTTERLTPKHKKMRLPQV